MEQRVKGDCASFHVVKTQIMIIPTTQFLRYYILFIKSISNEVYIECIVNQLINYVLN